LASAVVEHATAIVDIFIAAFISVVMVSMSQVPCKLYEGNNCKIEIGISNVYQSLVIAIPMIYNYPVSMNHGNQ